YDEHSYHQDSSNFIVSAYYVYCSLYINMSHPSPTLFSYTALFRSRASRAARRVAPRPEPPQERSVTDFDPRPPQTEEPPGSKSRSEEHTSELQSHLNIVCRLLLANNKKEYKWRGSMSY